MQLRVRPGFRSRPASVLDFLVAMCVIASVASPWWISVPPAHLQETFGFESPACWLAIVALFTALLIEARAAVLALAVVELVLIGWFGWAMWVVTTPRFTHLGFPFVGTDLLGPGWYAAVVGLLITAAVVLKELEDRDAPIGTELWILTALPGFGLIRLGNWTRGLVWTALFTAAFLLRLHRLARSRAVRGVRPYRQRADPSQPRVDLACPRRPALGAQPRRDCLAEAPLLAKGDCLGLN